MTTTDEIFDRLPPHILEAEKALLAQMMRDNSIIPEIAGNLTDDDFYQYAHQWIFSAILELYDQDGVAEEHGVAMRLKERNRLKDVGGPQYILELHLNAPRMLIYQQCVRIIRICSAKRRLLEVFKELEPDCYDSSLPAEAVLAEAERRISAIADRQTSTDTHHAREIVAETWRAIDERSARNDARFNGVPSGFIDLDTMTAGFQPGEFVVIAARTSCGKTALAANIARHVVVEERVPVLFISLEQTRIELMERILCCQAQADGHRLRTGRVRQPESRRLLDAGELLMRAGLNIDDSPNQNLAHIVARTRRMKRTAGIGLVIIDYLQLITVDDRKENRQEQVAGISRRMKLLARELGIPVIVLAQLNRQVETRQDQRPKLSDLRESGAIEQDADVVLMLHRQDDGITDLLVQKQRNGPTGDVRLIYVKQHMRFETLGTMSGV